jgi:hypothetical protein
LASRRANCLEASKTQSQDDWTAGSSLRLSPGLDSACSPAEDRTLTGRASSHPIAPRRESPGSVQRTLSPSCRGRTWSEPASILAERPRTTWVIAMLPRRNRSQDSMEAPGSSGRSGGKPCPWPAAGWSQGERMDRPWESGSYWNSLPMHHRQESPNTVASRADSFLPRQPP